MLWRFLSLFLFSLFYGQIAFEFSLHITERVGSNTDDDDANATLVSYFLLVSLGATVQSLPPCKHLFSKKEAEYIFPSGSPHWYIEIAGKGGKAHNASLVNCAKYSSLGVNKWRTFAEWPSLSSCILWPNDASNGGSSWRVICQISTLNYLLPQSKIVER